jgi:hypothetical protein
VRHAEQETAIDQREREEGVFNLDEPQIFEQDTEWTK